MESSRETGTFIEGNKGMDGKINNKEWEKEGKNIFREGTKAMEELRIELEHKDKEDV